MSSHKPSKSRAFSRSSTASPIYQVPVATRTKSHGPPRVLPLPDIPLRSSREGSRSGSPTASPRLSSPRGSGDGPFLNVTAIEMVTGRSSDGLPFFERSGSATASSPPTTSTVITAAAMLGAASAGNATRPRASTSPMHTHTRTTGFLPTPVSETRTTVSTAVDNSSSGTARPATPAKPPLSNPVRAPSRPTRAHPVEPPVSNTILTDHLYASFLNGTCADVRLWVRKWNVSWQLHKMVLVQASFFQSLFMGGFSETSGARRSRKGKERASGMEDDNWTGDDIELQFDDPNITRAAFEICLSRLYSAHPSLHIPSSLLPDSHNPLTPSFPDGFTAPLGEMADTLRLHSQLATPRLLLSLLATTIYLGHAPLLKDVLGMILRTISPFTVCRYLEFALDGSIGEEEWAGQDAESARHLSGVGKELPIRSSHRVPSTVGEETPRGAETPLHAEGLPTNEEGEGKVGGFSGSLDNSPQKAEGVSQSGHRTLSRRSSRARLPHFYGVASNKVGEAVVCWLARWAVDILNAEGAASLRHEPQWSVWGHRGIPARFVRACLCSDHLFVRDELERYMLARRILELRRKGWERELDDMEGDISLQQSRHSSSTNLLDETLDPYDEDEIELRKVFAEGIYYSHMSFDDLATISADTDPYTELPFGPLNVLQSAHWASTNLRSRVQNQSDLNAEGELGLSRSTADITAGTRRLSSSRGKSINFSGGSDTPRRSFDPYETIRSSNQSPISHQSSQVYHPVVGDESLRFGHNGLAVPHTLLHTNSPYPDFGFGTPLEDGLAALRLGADGVSETKPARRVEPPHGESTAFGLASGKRALSDFSAPGLGAPKGVNAWTTAEPFRFSVEFWGVNQLADKDRLYSPVHFYAGSWWLVYLQIMRRTDKNGEPQLGIYLQRWDMSQPPPAPSSPPDGAIRGGRLSQPKTTETLASGVSPGDSEDIAGSIPITLRAPGGPTPTPSERFRAGGGSLGNRPDRRASVGAAAAMDEETSFDVWRRRSETSAIFSRSPNNSRVPLIPPTGASPPSTGSSPESRGRPRSGAAVAEYLDERKVVKAYFSVICSSALGTSLVRFNSSPDVFAQSQSWGWKSSALRSDEYLGLPLDARGGAVIDHTKDFAEEVEGVLAWTGSRPPSAGTGQGRDGQGRGNLRASVVLGVV